MNCIILDDEPAAIAILERYIQKVPDFQHLQSFHSPTEALAFIKQQSVELIFLDIQMPICWELNLSNFCLKEHK